MLSTRAIHILAATSIGRGAPCFCCYSLNAFLQSIITTEQAAITGIILRCWCVCRQLLPHTRPSLPAITAKAVLSTTALALDSAGLHRTIMDAGLEELDFQGDEEAKDGEHDSAS